MTLVLQILSLLLSPLRAQADTNRAQIEQFVQLMFETSSDPYNKFKLVFRDFLISLKEFSGDDNAELFIEEKEAETERKALEERQAALRVPGMLKPEQLDDDAEL